MWIGWYSVHSTFVGWCCIVRIDWYCIVHSSLCAGYSIVVHVESSNMIGGWGVSCYHQRPRRLVGPVKHSKIGEYCRVRVNRFEELNERYV